MDVFSLVTLPPPRSTLFPYTTLFRSMIFPSGLKNSCPAISMSIVRVWIFRKPLPSVRIVQMRSTLDRKSTRLNSSHTVISYAVFCLKKKKLENVHEFRYETQLLVVTH